MAGRPLSVLMSQALIAFTIEFDNEFERRMPHRTSLARGGDGPWLTSMTMWANFVRLVPPEGRPWGTMIQAAQLSNVGGLQRWGYITIDDDKMVRLTRYGAAAREVWDSLAAEIEQRWRARFGDDRIERLIAALAPATSPDLPRFLPVVSFHIGMRSVDPGRMPSYSADDLISHLAQAVFAFTRAYERRSLSSLPIGANVLRLLSEDGVRVRDLPRPSGISKEGITGAVNGLVRDDLARVTSEANQKVARLTALGVQAQAQHPKIIRKIESTWPSADEIRAAIPAGDELALGLEPPPDGWRSQRRYAIQTAAVLSDPAGALPHHPMVLHRGGYPDGS